MTYYADLSRDLPTPYERKRVVFYRQGLKVYGLLPYLLQRRLKAQFFSGSVNWGGVRISAGSFEQNWTAISYTQTSEALASLLDWLSSDAGFEVAIASREDFDDDIFSANIFRMPPKTWHPVGDKALPRFLRIHADMQRSEIAGLLSMAKEQ